MAKQIDMTQLNSDISEVATKAKHVSEKNGELRNLIKKKIDGRGYESVAFGMLRRIERMSDEKFADFWRTFEGGLSEVVGQRLGQASPEMDLDPAPEPVPFNAEPELTGDADFDETLANSTVAAE